MIDPYHLNAYNKMAVNYNRDVEIFPVLKSIFTSIYGACPYNSPTDMGVNMAGFAIINKDISDKASKNEIIRRYYQAKVDYRNGKINESTLDKISLLMQELNISSSDRKCVEASLNKKKETNTESMAIELSDGKIITAKTSSLLLASSALILNALKYISKIDDEYDLIVPSIIEPISEFKTKILGKRNPRLHLNEVLNALAISAKSNPLAKRAIKHLKDLKGCQAHSTVILPEVDKDIFKKLAIDVTTEDEVYGKRLYSK